MALSRWTLLQQDRGRWLLGCADGEIVTIHPLESSEVEPEPLAEELADALRAAGYDGQPVVIGLAARSCLVAAVPIESPAAARDRTGLLYALEQWLPVSAEDLVADFYLAGEHALGIAVEFAEIESMVQTLEQRGVPVQSIAPTALLGLGEILSESFLDAVELVLWQNEDAIEVMQLREGRLSDWVSLPSLASRLQEHLNTLLLVRSEPLRVLDLGLFEAAAQAAATLPGVQLRSQEQKSLAETAVAAGYSILGGKKTLLIDLRRGALAPQDQLRAVRRPLNFALAAAAVFFLLFAGSAWWRAQRFEQRYTQLEAEQVELYKNLFPAAKQVPPGVRSRLESEYAKRAGLTGALDNLPLSSSALIMLHDLLVALPREMRYRLLEIRMEGNQLFLDGEVRTFSDADRIAEGLRQQGYEVESPQSRQLPDRSVAVRIAAARRVKGNSGP